MAYQPEFNYIMQLCAVQQKLLHFQSFCRAIKQCSKRTISQSNWQKVLKYQNTERMVLDIDLRETKDDVHKLEVGMREFIHENQQKSRNGIVADRCHHDTQCEQIWKIEQNIECPTIHTPPETKETV